MKRLRPAAALVALALVAALVAPAASAMCEARGHRCPGMSPDLAALCHQAKTMAPDCCKQERQVPDRRSSTELGAPTLLAVLADVATDVAAASAYEPFAAEGAFSRTASFHELGLFTLHAAFRI